jgi:hypothetical protein
VIRAVTVEDALMIKQHVDQIAPLHAATCRGLVMTLSGIGKSSSALSNA